MVYTISRRGLSAGKRLSGFFTGNSSQENIFSWEEFLRKKCLGRNFFRRIRGVFRKPYSVFRWALRRLYRVTVHGLRNDFSWVLGIPAGDQVVNRFTDLPPVLNLPLVSPLRVQGIHLRAVGPVHHLDLPFQVYRRGVSPQPFKLHGPAPLGFHHGGAEVCSERNRRNTEVLQV